jgi:hypothetical protein
MASTRKKRHSAASKARVALEAAKQTRTLAERASFPGPSEGRETMLRKQVLKGEVATAPGPGEMDIAACATVLVTSEAHDQPIDNAFDHRRGPGGSRWVAAEPGAQTLTLVFDTPQTIRQISLEIEEREVSRAQELELSVSRDGGKTYCELLRQGYNFSPPGTTFEREVWPVTAEGITHLRLWIMPDKGGKPCRATITSLALR